MRTFSTSSNVDVQLIGEVRYVRSGHMPAPRILAFMDPVSLYLKVTSVCASQGTLDHAVKIKRTCVRGTGVVMGAPASEESNNMPAFARETQPELSASE